MSPADGTGPLPEGGMAPRKALGIGASIVLLGALAAALILLTNSHLPAYGHIVSTATARKGTASSRHLRESSPPSTLPPATAGTRRPAGSTDLLGLEAQASFDSLAASMPAQIGMAIAPLRPGKVQKLGQLQLGHAWSSIKVPILVTLMREGRLSPEEEQWANEALTASDNTAAADLFQQLERTHGGISGASTAVQEVLAMAGDTSTTVTIEPPPPGAVSTYGQTEWSLTGSVQFYREMARGCLLRPAGTEYVLGLMKSVIPEQRWGLGEAGFPADWKVGMKGGWGPEDGTGRYLVRQSGVVQQGDTGFAVTMIVKDDSGSFEAGSHDLTRIATWLRENLRFPLPLIDSCA